MIAARPTPAGSRRPARRRLAVFGALTLATTATTLTVGPPGAGAAEMTFAYQCDGEATAIRFPDVAVSPTTGGMTTGRMNTTFKMVLPPLPGDSTISSVVLGVPRPRLATTGGLSLIWAMSVGASSGGLTFGGTSSGGTGIMNVMLGGTQPAATAVPVALSIDSQLQADPSKVTQGTITHPLPTVTVTADQGTVSCTPDADQVLGTTTVYFTGVPRATSSSTSTTTTTTPPATHPLCPYRTRVPAWFWSVLVALFDVRC